MAHFSVSRVLAVIQDGETTLKLVKQTRPVEGA